MPKKVLADADGHKIVADFKNDEEYILYCQTVARECLDTIMHSLSLDELISLWKDRNPANAK